MSNQDSSNGHDPWKRDPWKKGSSKPNDLDQIARKWQKRFSVEFQRIMSRSGNRNVFHDLSSLHLIKFLRNS